MMFYLTIGQSSPHEEKARAQIKRSLANMALLLGEISSNLCHKLQDIYQKQMEFEISWHLIF